MYDFVLSGNESRSWVIMFEDVMEKRQLFGSFRQRDSREGLHKAFPG